MLVNVFQNLYLYNKIENKKLNKENREDNIEWLNIEGRLRQVIRKLVQPKIKNAIYLLSVAEIIDKFDYLDERVRNDIVETLPWNYSQMSQFVMRAVRIYTPKKEKMINWITRTILSKQKCNISLITSKNKGWKR